jgi:hypothetical protein
MRPFGENGRPAGQSNLAAMNDQILQSIDAGIKMLVRRAAAVKEWRESHMSGG